MFQLAHPEYLHFAWLVVLPVLFYWLYMRWRKKSIRKTGDKKLLEQLMPERPKTKPVIRIVLISFAILLLAFGLANPQVGSKMETVKREGIDVAVAIDISRSMQAQDLKPNRLERAKQFTSRLIEKLGGDRLSFIVFAGNAYMQMPLTVDHSAAKLFLNTVSTDLAPTQGTAIAEAIHRAEESFKDTNNNKASHVIIILSDGEDHEGDVIAEAENAAKNGTKIYTLGLGTPTGAPIPLYNKGAMTGFQKDENGSVVMSKLDESMLQKIASITDGKYYRLGQGNQPLDALLKEFSTLKKSGIESRVYTDYENQFQWFLGGALLLLVLEFLVTNQKSKWFSSWDPFKTETK